MQKPSLSRLLVLFLLVMASISCSEIGLDGSQTPTPPLTLHTPTARALPLDASTAARIRAQGFLLVGVRYDDDPFGFVDEQGDLIGFDIELAREFALRWLGDADAVRFVQVTNASVNERLRTGQVDLVIGALPRNQSAVRDMNFSAAYYYDGLALLLRSSTLVTGTALINGPGELDGGLVGVVEDSDTEAPLLQAAGSAGPRVVYYPDYFSAVVGLEAEVVEAVVGPRRILARLSAGDRELILSPRFSRIPYSIGVPKDDGPFLDLVNVTLMSMLNDGAYARLFEKWFPDETPPELEMWAGTSRLSFDGLSAQLAPAPPTIQDIESGGYLVVGLLDDQLPFGDFDANGVARGFEADIVRVLVGRWLEDVSAVQFVPHTEESGMQALKSGEIDLLAARLPHTLPRDDEIDFSQAMYEGGIGLLVSAGSGFETLGALEGRVVAVPGGGTLAEDVQRAMIRAGAAVSLRTVDDVEAALAGVVEGRYHAYAGMRSDLLNLAFTHSGFIVLDERLTSRPIALGLRQNDAALRDLVNLTLQELAAQGRYAALYDDWFGTDPPFAIEIWPGAAYRSLKLDRPAVVVPTATP